jgi:hypothetical protein
VTGCEPSRASEWLCVIAMRSLRKGDDPSGYIAAGFMLAFAALGIVAGVRLLGLRWRGLGFGLAWVGMGIWLLLLPKRLQGEYMSTLGGPLVIYVLGVAGNVYVILALRRWRDRFRKARRSIGTSVGTSTAASALPGDSGPGRFRSVVVVAGAVLASVGVLGIGAGVRLLRRRSRSVRGRKTSARTQGRSEQLDISLAGVVVAILAALATAGVFLYSRGVDYLPSETGGWLWTSSPKWTSRPGRT